MFGLSVLTTHAEAVSNRLQADAAAAKALLYTLLHTLSHLAHLAHLITVRMLHGRFSLFKFEIG